MKWYMMNIYFRDLEAIVDFFKNHEKLYNKTNEHFRDKVKKECLWKRFINGKLSVKLCYTKDCLL